MGEAKDVHLPKEKQLFLPSVRTGTGLRGGHRVSLAEGFAGWGKISMYSTGFLSAIL